MAVERFAVLDFHRSLPNARLHRAGWTLYGFVVCGLTRLVAAMSSLTPAYLAQAVVENHIRLLPEEGQECRRCVIGLAMP